ncbi:hypothetical protein Syun_026479 [Stephania yunnanensis]|uniref:Uncharacterized protein n=1 Tax=Stephania yunnanensis TaxID=152371 RepID=A0AAP0HWJ4_9MAGN
MDNSYELMFFRCDISVVILAFLNRVVLGGLIESGLKLAKRLKYPSSSIHRLPPLAVLDVVTTAMRVITGKQRVRPEWRGDDAARRWETTRLEVRTTAKQTRRRIRSLSRPDLVERPDPAEREIRPPRERETEREKWRKEKDGGERGAPARRAQVRRGVARSVRSPLSPDLVERPDPAEKERSDRHERETKREREREMAEREGWR